MFSNFLAAAHAGISEHLVYLLIEKAAQFPFSRHLEEYKGNKDLKIELMYNPGALLYFLLPMITFY